MTEGWFGRWSRRARKAVRTPPRVLASRINQEVRVVGERMTLRGRPARLTGAPFLRATRSSSIDELWERLAARPFPAVTSGLDAEAYERMCPGERARILKAADKAVRHEVDLLGSGPVELGEKIDWHCDYKTGLSWPMSFFRGIDFNNPERPSDVKFPWEVSRMQWLIPAGQAYVLTGDERFAYASRDVIDQWIEGNPYGVGVNWACTMEVALRILTWTWLFHVFKGSDAWSDRESRKRFLEALYLHGEFTAGHLERSDVNGNHYTADAVGLVFAGLVFGAGRLPGCWQRIGWEILVEELPRQVNEDGVDFEASSAYHRLVAELFLVAALYRQAVGLNVPGEYAGRLKRMGWFTAAYTAPDGQAPLWGDADDARALPFGAQDINDHRYLCALVGVGLDEPDLACTMGGDLSELVWWFGCNLAEKVRITDSPLEGHHKFSDSGVYILGRGGNRVFIDCAPVGLAGRGGHGHNDCLSFEAWLGGVKLITDSGAYLYTASYEERNAFRSTAAHNTPEVDGEEINRYPKDGSLWFLQYDAVPCVHECRFSTDVDYLSASHSGYARLKDRLNVWRQFWMYKDEHRLVMTDKFSGSEEHQFCERLHLDPSVVIGEVDGSSVLLSVDSLTFRVSWSSESGLWNFATRPNRISRSYGVVEDSNVLMWTFKGVAPTLNLVVEALNYR